MRILVTAGPTHEPIDDVRYLANRSSGLMGYATARAALSRGHSVTLVTGPTGLRPPRGARVIPVETALEMLAASQAAFEKSDALVMTAAVADWRPARRIQGKLKKSAGIPVLRLRKNPDILAFLGKMARDQVLVGFALEAGSTSAALAAARAKLVRKRVHLIVLNHPGSLGRRDAAGVTLVTEREAVPVGAIDKARLARLIVSFVETRQCGRGAKDRPGKA